MKKSKVKKSCQNCVVPLFENEDEEYLHCNIAHADIHKTEVATFYCSKFEAKTENE